MGRNSSRGTEGTGMKLLLVDDQTSVVSGLTQGIAWEEIGIDLIYTAYNAIEAKKILNTEKIDIMLCDIEMPVENGISLLSYAREEGMELECIFLTAHAEFDYAKDAIKLGSFDYILQPAEYGQIMSIVKKAVSKIHEKEKVEKAYSFGNLLLASDTDMTERLAYDLLHGRLTKKEYDGYVNIGKLPEQNAKGYLVILQLIGCRMIIEDWDKHLLCFTLNNIISEIFAPYGQDILFTFLKDADFGFITYGMDGYTMDQEGVIRQSGLLIKIIKDYLKCDAAIYLNIATRMEEMDDEFKLLSKFMQRNVSMESGIFQMNKDGNGIKTEYHLPQVNRWLDYFCSGFYDTVKEEAYAYLRKLMDNGEMSLEVLMNFYLDFLKIIYGVMDRQNIQVHLFFNRDYFDIYSQAYKSVEKMMEFIDYIIQSLDEYYKEQTKCLANPVEEIVLYIHNNIEEDILRKDIAEHIHLNADYVARIFKNAMGISLKEYIIIEKMKVAQNLIKSTKLPISFIASKVGYGNFSYFSSAYKKEFGVSPTEERRK